MQSADLLRRIGRIAVLAHTFSMPLAAEGRLPADWERHVVLQSEDVTCGAAALATLLHLELDVRTSEEEIIEAMLRGRTLEAVRTARGFSLLDLLLYVEANALAGMGEDGLSLSDLAERVPAIVPLEDGDWAHFVVVVGRQGDGFAIADPAYGPRWVDVTSFKRIWRGIAFRVFPGSPAQK